VDARSARDKLDRRRSAKLTVDVDSRVTIFYLRKMCTAEVIKWPVELGHGAMVATAQGEKTPHKAPTCEGLDPPYDIKLFCTENYIYF